MVGPVIQTEDKTIVVAFLHPRRFENGDDGTKALSPLFRDAGITHIKLDGGNLNAGEVEVTVLPLEEDAKPSMDLMYPVVFPKSSDPNRRVRWVKLIMGLGSTAFSAQVLDGDYSQTELTALRRHPDWDILLGVANSLREYEVMRRDFLRARTDRKERSSGLAAFKKMRATKNTMAASSSSTLIIRTLQKRVTNDFERMSVLQESAEEGTLPNRDPSRVPESRTGT